MVTNLVRHLDLTDRESDGAVHWKSMCPKRRRAFPNDGAQSFSDSDWLDDIYTGSNRTRFQYCKNSNDVLLYLRAQSRAHTGGELIAPELKERHTMWDQALLAASEIPTGMVLEGLYKSKLQDSVRLQTVLAMYEQENVRNNEPPNCSRLKTMVRRQIDQTMRTRNFRALSEIVERGAVTKSQIGRKDSVERKVRECYQWKAIGQCSK